MIANGELFLKKITYWLVVEQCSVIVAYKSMALAPPWVVSCPPHGELKPLAPTESILAAPARSLHLAHGLFSPFILPYSHHITSGHFQHLFPFLPSSGASSAATGPHRGHAVVTFKRHGTSASDTYELNTNHFPADRQSCLVAACFQMLIMQVFLLTQFQALTLVIPTKNVLPWKARRGQ